MTPADRKLIRSRLPQHQQWAQQRADLHQRTYVTFLFRKRIVTFSYEIWTSLGMPGRVLKTVHPQLIGNQNYATQSHQP